MTWKPINGIVPPLVTPLLGRDEIDVDGTHRLLEHMIAGGVAGLFVLGTTGEAPSLSYRLRREFIELVCKAVDGRLPVFVGVTDTAFVETITLANVASDAGADAVVLTTPYYFPAGQTELKLYVDHVVDQLPLPLMLYNMPSLTKVWFEYETLQQLSQHKSIVGVKDSSGDMDYFQQIMGLKEERPDWSMFIGPEHLTAEAVQMGANGGVNGGANVFPELFAQYYQAAVDQDESKVESLQEKVDALQAIYDVGKYASRHIKATKCALSIKGICSDHMAEPFNHFLPPQRAKVEAILNRLQF
ncbi:dihydrodipicolinate synthase family protein [Stieleria marina]|uniref:4-hydroxy-tetrahydrodipicolinate synthase n=1 Tax=Stieleria marina TaxID=1930275 RepID=A0A517P0E1_9BACT|nr:4-hydroxy-tetrahydrodipicolinate synthase [Planctomycetes bacterium K23_9]